MLYFYSKTIFIINVPTAGWNNCIRCEKDGVKSMPITHEAKGVVAADFGNQKGKRIPSNSIKWCDWGCKTMKTNATTNSKQHAHTNPSPARSNATSKALTAKMSSLWRSRTQMNLWRFQKMQKMREIFEWFRASTSVTLWFLLRGVRDFA